MRIHGPRGSGSTALFKGLKKYLDFALFRLDWYFQLPAATQPAARAGAEDAIQQQQQQGGAPTEPGAEPDTSQEPDPAVVRRYL